MTWSSTTTIVLQQSSTFQYLTLDDLVALAISPFIVVGIVLFVMESVLGTREQTAAGTAGAVLTGLAIIAPADLNAATASALQREFGWRIGFEVGRPVALYWGFRGILFLLGAYGESQESTDD